MGIADILGSIDLEIATLQRARALLAGGSVGSKKRGRPAKNSTVALGMANKPAKKGKKRKLSPEGRKRIAEAQKRRWEAKRKTAAGGK